MKPASTKRPIAGKFSIAGFNKILSQLLALSVILWLFSACGLQSFSLTSVLNQPETKLFDVQSSVVMKALQRVLAEKKFKVNPERTDQQSLETEWLQDGFVRSMVLAKVSALSKYRSQLTLQLLVQEKGFLRDSWQPVDKVGKTVYDDFLNDVLIESYRVLYDRP